MPEVVTYHARIPIETRSGKIVMLRTDLPDWCDDRGIITMIADRVGADTVDDVLANAGDWYWLESTRPGESVSAAFKWSDMVIT